MFDSILSEISTLTGPKFHVLKRNLMNFLLSSVPLVLLNNLIPFASINLENLNFEISKLTRKTIKS